MMTSLEPSICLYNSAGFICPTDVCMFCKGTTASRWFGNMATTGKFRLALFEQAMETLYGNLSAVDDPDRWTPPPNSGGHRGRYLWTDAFGVINFLTLHQELSGTATGKQDTRYLMLARRLVDTV